MCFHAEFVLEEKFITLKGPGHFLCPELMDTLICNRKPAILNLGKRDIVEQTAKGTAIISACFGNITDNISFENGCFVFHLNISELETF